MNTSGDDRMSTKKKKTVRFRDSLDEVHTIRRTTPEEATDLLMAKQALLAFLNTSVIDIIEDSGKYRRKNARTTPQSPVQEDYVRTEYMNAIASLNYLLQKPMSANSKAQILDFLHEHESKPAKTIVKMAIDDPKNLVAFFGALVLMRMGLKTFINFNQCANRCHEVATYATNPNDYSVKLKPLSKLKRDLVYACFEAHRDIEDAIGIDDIRQFDKLLRYATRGQCSFILPKH